VWVPAFLPLLAARLEAAGFGRGGPAIRTLLGGPWEQWHGDLVTGGRGEIFLRPTLAAA
jgi:hypothetical protein